MQKYRATAQNHCFICPMEYPDGCRYAWKLDIRRSGKVHVHQFDFAEYGGEAAALDAAEHLRNQLVLEMPQPLTYENRQRLTRHNTSGHPPRKPYWPAGPAGTGATLTLLIQSGLAAVMLFQNHGPSIYIASLPSVNIWRSCSAL